MIQNETNENLFDDRWLNIRWKIDCKTQKKNI